MSDPRTRVELERAIEDSPDDLNRYLVLADALGTAGSRHGELIVLQAHVERTRDAAAKRVLQERFDALLRELRPKLFSPALDTDPSLFDYEWRWGFVEKLTVRYWHHDAGEDVYRALARMLAAPALRFLRALKVTEATPTLLELLAESLLTTVSEVELHGLAPTLQGPFGPLDAVDQAFPRLERLRLDGLPVLWGDANLRQLQALHLRGVDPVLDTAEWLSGAAWPRLTELELSMELLPRVNERTFPSLQSLHLWLPHESVLPNALELLRKPLRHLRLSGPDPLQVAQTLASLPKVDADWLELELPAEELPPEVRRGLPKLVK